MTPGPSPATLRLPMDDPLPLPASRSDALCVYAEPLVSGRRVLVVGDSSDGLGARLVDLEARVVHVYDPNADRAREELARAPRGVTLRPLPEGDFDVRDGAFDLAIVPDLGLVPDPALLLGRLRRLVGSEGAVVVAVRNPEAAPAPGRVMGYYELYDLVAMQFAQVRMVGELPFSGVALAELGLEGEPEVSVDTQLAAEAEQPPVFVAVGSQNRVDLPEYAIIQLPAAKAPPVQEADSPVSHRAALVEAQLRASALSAQVEELRAAQVEEQRARSASDAEIADRNAKLRDAEARAADHYVRAEHLAQEVQEERRQRARLELEIAVLRKSAIAPERVSELETAAAAAEQRADALHAELALAGEAHAAELAQIEAVLRERARAIQELEHEVSRRERIVHELVSALEEAQGREAQAAPAAAMETGPALDVAEAAERVADLEAENDSLRAKLDALALEAARREGDLTTTGWRVVELEQQISALRADTAREPKLAAPQAPNATALEEELAVLRQALAQEHEARVRAESGDDLAKARAELARQAVLIEQLSRELDVQDRGRLGREGASPP